MARTLPLLDAAQRREFDLPPKFTPAQRALFFALPEWGAEVLRALVAAHSRGGFVLQVGYFKATGRFFPADRFWAADREYVHRVHALGEIDWERYDRTTAFYHRRDILRQFGVAPFEDAQAALLAQVTHFARHQMNPVAVFRSAAEYLRSHRLEVPTYATLAGVVTLAFRHVEQHLTTQLPHVLTPALQEQLDELFATDDQTPASRHHPYRLSALKRSLELMRPAAIRANVQDYGYLKRLYHQVAPVAEALGLSDELVRYYARYVERAQFFQVQQQADKKYLMVVCFILHQYYELGDVLTETFLQAVQTHRNAARRDTQERVYRQQQETAGLLAQVLDGVELHGAALAQLEQTVLLVCAHARGKNQRLGGVAAHAGCGRVWTGAPRRPAVAAAHRRPPRPVLPRGGRTLPGAATASGRHFAARRLRRQSR